MQGKTHFAAALATSLVVCHPQTIPVFIAGGLTGAIGGILPDLDSRTSEAHQQADRIIGITIGAAVIMTIIDALFHTGIYRKIVMRNSPDAWIGIIAFVIICIFGMHQPHRSFMHSILALLLLSYCFGRFFPNTEQYFFAGYASHLVLDALNRKRERLLWPIGKGACLNLCSADGIADAMIRWISIAAFVVTIIMFAVCQIQLHI